LAACGSRPRRLSTSFSKHGDEYERCCYFLSHQQHLLAGGKDIFS
jgi:hypothetical protein